MEKSVTLAPPPGKNAELRLSGLDINNDVIMEAACLITDGQLNVVAEGINIVINQPPHVLDNMDDWCKVHHAKSGLTEACRNSTITLEMAEQRMLAYVRQYTTPGKCPLAGNTVHEDKKFLAKSMPQFTSHLHYRIVDVSTIKELCRRWYPEEFKKAPKKTWTHRAMGDIKESIMELQYYRSSVFK